MQEVGAIIILILKSEETETGSGERPKITQPRGGGRI